MVSVSKNAVPHKTATRWREEITCLPAICAKKKNTNSSGQILRKRLVFEINILAASSKELLRLMRAIRHLNDALGDDRVPMQYSVNPGWDGASGAGAGAGCKAGSPLLLYYITVSNPMEYFENRKRKSLLH